MTSTNFAINSNPAAIPEPVRLKLDDTVFCSSKVASRSLFENRDTAKSSSPDGLRVSDLNDSAVQSPETVKTRSIAGTLLSWAVNTKASIWTAVMMLKSVRYWMLLGTPSQDARAEVDKKLNELTGSVHVAKMIHTISPSIAELILDKLMSLELHASLATFLEKEQGTFHTLIDVLLPVIYQNFALDFRKCAEGKDSEKNVSISDVLSHICRVIDKHLPYINETLEIIEKTKDQEKKNGIICHVFAGMVDEFMAIGLPKGVNELPLLNIPFFSNHYWEMLQKNALPLLFYKLYRQFALPFHESKKEILINQPGGESLASLAQLAGEEVAEIIPTLFIDTPDDVKDKDTAVIHASPISTSIAKSVCSLLNGSDLLKNWFASWFSKELIELGTNGSHGLKKLWGLLGGYLEPLLIHVFVTMSQNPEPRSKSKDRVPDTLGIITIRLMAVCSTFFNANAKRIDERIKEFEHSGEDYREDKKLLELFKPLANDLLFMMGLSNPDILPLPGFLKAITVEQLHEQAPAFLLRQYVAITNANVNSNKTHKKLRSLLFDPKNLEDPAIAIKVVSELQLTKESFSLNMFNQFYNILWYESGTERLAKTLEMMCSVVASELVDSVMKQLGVADQNLLKADSNAYMGRFYSGLKSYVETALVEILVHLMSTVEEREPALEGSHPKCLIPVNVLLQLDGMIEDRFKGLKSKLAKIAATHPIGSEGYNNEANELFIGLSADLQHFCGVNPFAHLPLEGLPAGEAIKELLWSAVKNVALPDALRKMYMEVTQWQGELHDSYIELSKSYHTSHPKWACKVMAQYSTDYIRYYLLNSNDEAAKLLLESLKTYFNDSKHLSGTTIADTLGELKSDSEYMLSQNLQAIGANNDAQFSAIWPALTLYTEAVIAKFLSGFSRTLREIERDNPDFTVDLAIQILKDTAGHFSAVGKATDTAGVDRAYEVPLAEMLTAFGVDLHDGIPLDPLDPPELKDEARLKGCFIPLSQKLLKLSNLTAKDFPVPSFMREQMGDLVVNKMLPLALMGAFQKAMEPQVRNALMLSFVQTFYAAFNGVEVSKRDGELAEALVQPNPKQKRLYETCGAVVLELIKLIPDTAVQHVFMKEKVKNMSAEAIGDALMPQLSSLTLLQLIDSAIFSGLPGFHPSKWEGKFGREDLVPRKAFVRPDGKMELKPVKDFKFTFPTVQAEIDALEKAKLADANEIRRELRDGFTKTISQQLHLKAWAVIKSLWLGMHEHLNDLIERLFPEKGLDVKAAFDRISGKIFFDVIGTVIRFLFIPVVSLVKFVTEKTVIDRRSDDIIKNLELEIMENLFYKWTDTVMDALLKLQKRPVTA